MWLFVEMYVEFVIVVGVNFMIVGLFVNDQKVLGVVLFWGSAAEVVEWAWGFGIGICLSTTFVRSYYQLVLGSTSMLHFSIVCVEWPKLG